jgi:hypothetical protein
MKKSKKNKAGARANGKRPNGDAGPPAKRPKCVPVFAVERGKKSKQKLPCRIEKPEVDAAGLALAVTVRQQEELDNERRDVLAQFRERQAGIKDRQEALAVTVENSTVVRDVMCSTWLLADQSIMIVREDTEEVVLQRAATKEELQEELPAPPKAPSLEDIKNAGGDLGTLADQGLDDEGLDEDDDDGIVEDDYAPGDEGKEQQVEPA